MKILHPILQRNEAAQDIYDHPPDTPQRLRKLGAGLLAYCREAKLLEHKKSHYLIMRNMEHACAAPILHAIEIELSQQIAAMRRNGMPLAPSESTDATHFDGFFDMGRRFEGRNRTFLRASSALVNAVVTRFLRHAEHDPQHWARPILGAYNQWQPRYARVWHEREGTPPDNITPNQRIRRISILSNATSLGVLVPAALHAPLWSDGEEDGLTVLLQKADELGWPQSVTAEFNKRYFPGQAVDDYLPKDCPFEHDEARIAMGSIYHIPSLQNGPWPIMRNCPADMPLMSPRYPEYGRISAATMRTVSSIYIGSETLWR
jgi:hypothetical protein